MLLGLVICPCGAFTANPSACCQLVTVCVQETAAWFAGSTPITRRDCGGEEEVRGVSGCARARVYVCAGGKRGWRSGSGAAGCVRHRAQATPLAGSIDIR